MNDRPNRYSRNPRIQQIYWHWLHIRHSLCSNWDFLLLWFITRSPPFTISKYRRVIYIPTKVALHLLMKILVNYFWSRNVYYLEPLSICINILAGWRPCLSVVMVAQLSEADDVVWVIKRQWNDKKYWCQNIFMSKNDISLLERRVGLQNIKLIFEC